MARSNKRSAADDLIDVVALLPWWAGIGFAFATYMLLHRLAVPEAADAAQPAALGLMLGRSLAAIGQYLLPLIGIVAAAVSAWHRRQQAARAADVTPDDAAPAIERLGRREFRLLIGDAFRLQGYQVVDTDDDASVDMVLRKERQTVLVRCKQWNADKIGVEVVQALYRAVVARGAGGGFVVTSGRFSREARAFAAGCNVRLIDGPILNGLIAQARSTRRAATAPAAADTRPA